MTTKIVAILNLTPDSFSDGGKFNQPNFALTHLQKILQEGADVIDVGAESTRPNATAISAEEEWRRLEKILPPAIEEVKKFNRDNSKQVEVSIDTYHSLTARRACQLGVQIINDVSGLIDEEMIALIAEKKLRTVFMHNLSIHANHSVIINKSLNVTQEILRWAFTKIAQLEKKGIEKSQLIFDPGIGFSKDGEQSLRIIKNIATFKSLGLPIYVGHSKKSFLDELKVDGLLNTRESRAEKTLIISKYLARNQVNYIRVHDVAENKSAINNSHLHRKT